MGPYPAGAVSVRDPTSTLDRCGSDATARPSVVPGIRGPG